MRATFFAASALCGLVAAFPQKIDVDAAEAVPTPAAPLGPNISNPVPVPITYNQAAATKSAAKAVATGGVDKDNTVIVKRGVNDPCAQQPGGNGPKPGDGSVAAYQDSSNALRSAAQSASAPQGYVEAFKDLSGSSQQIGYLTYKNIDDGTYGVQQCANFCDSEKFCLGFNIFYERDPSVNPADACPNPDPITNVKCAIYGYPVAAGAATNQGQWRENFQVVIVGSNGYSKLSPQCKPAPGVSGFNAPTNLPAAIDAPYVKKADGSNYDTYNGMKLFNDGPFDPSLCASSCQGQTTFDKAHPADDGSYKPCNFFTAYILTKNGVPLGTYCALYTQSWGISYATNTGYYSGSDEYKVLCAASYSITNPDNSQAP